MRLRVFQARTIQEAMAQMRKALGDDAVLVSTQDAEGSVRLTAAIDTPDDDLASLLAARSPSDVEARIRRALARHGTPSRIAAALTEDAARTGLDEPEPALAHALRQRWRFSEIGIEPAKPVMLIGPPGTGKTAAIAKFAAMAVLRERTVRVVSTDTARAGGVAQLAALLQPLGLVPETVSAAEDLTEAMTGSTATLFIDTTGINPFRSDELAHLAEFVRAAKAEPVLVLPATYGPADVADVAGNFVALGVRRMIVTQLDIARRLGGLTVAPEAGLSLAEAGFSPLIGKALAPLSATGLARLLLREQPTGGGSGR